MTLKAYRQKRHFRRTPEPRGDPVAGRGPLRFVVQKHDATRLHYDFRLELDGALKSWAVPKGPSLDPADRRLAVMVEDHPLSYRKFEGVILAGNYGAGSVIVWDEGTYHAVGTPDRRSSEEVLRDGLARGHLSIVLHGRKLRGEFSLVKLKRGEANAWLLLKKRDEFAAARDVTHEDQSVVSGLTIDEVGTAPKGRARKRRAPKAEMPRDVRPMLATLVDEPFDRRGWLFEPKWDGYRAIAEVSRDGVRLYSRNHTSFDSKFAPIVRSLKQLGHEAVLDGEVVVLNADGRSDFQLLQNYQKTGRGHLVYYVFDLLHFDGRDLRALPLVERKELLRGILGNEANIRFSDHIADQGAAFFRAAVAKGLEGIIGKDGSSPYREGARSPTWVKVKTRRRQEAVIAGFTSPRGRRNDLGALILGVYDGPDLVYIGHTGGGLDAAGLADLRARLDPLVRPECPFRKKPRTNAPARWVEPQLVCEVVFQEWTADGRMRQPIFIGLREDKPARSVRREVARPPADVVDEPDVPAPRATRADNHPRPSFTNLGKIYWPEDGYTKGDLIEYYRRMSAVILPHLRDRPMSLHRHPDGIAGGSFFQKDVSQRPPPDWVPTVTLPSGDAGKTVTYIVCQDEPTLLYLANLGCIELNPWLSRTGTIDRPDFLVIDLDPEDLPFARVVEAAVAVHKLLDRAGAESLCKTSGKRGLHVCVPLGAQYPYEVARQFAEVVGAVVHRELPRSTSVVRCPALRQGRVYLDYLQNRTGQTLAAPYSVRPVSGAPVSTPLAWREISRRLNPAAFTIKTIAKRVDRLGDLWAPIQSRGIDLAACLDRIAGKATR